MESVLRHLFDRKQLIFLSAGASSPLSVVNLPNVNCFEIIFSLLQAAGPNWVEQEQNVNKYHLKSNFNPLIPVQGSFIGKQASQNREDKPKKQPSTAAKKTKKEKARHQLQQKLDKKMGPAKPVFQSPVLPAVNKPDPVKPPRSNTPDIKKPSKVHPIDYDVNPSNKKWADSVPGILDEATSVITPTDPLKKPLSPRSEGLVVSRHNKVHPQKSSMSPDVQLVFTGASTSDYEMQQENKEELVELNGSDNKTPSPKHRIGLDDQPGTSTV